MSPIEIINRNIEFRERDLPKIKKNLITDIETGRDISKNAEDYTRTKSEIEMLYWLKEILGE